jgi:hypothetical protein
MFTALNDPTVEDGLKKQLAVIVQEIVATYGSHSTIILAGGFGRGEGSIRNLDGVAVPLHDFDIFTITDRAVDAKKHALLEETLYARLSETVGTRVSPDKFALGVEVIPSKSLARLPPDISTYELKAASTVLHGPDVRSLIRVSSKDVSLASGAITLFHRTTALLKNVEPEFLAEEFYPPDRVLEAIYECCKIYTEICTALSLLGGFYYPSYRERALRLPKYYNRFPELKRVFSDLPEKVEKYTEMKLKSDFSPMIGRPIEEWVQARHDLELSLRFFLSKMFHIDFDPRWAIVSKQMEEKFRGRFFRDFLAFYLARYKLAKSPIVTAANTLFQAYDHHSFRRRVEEDGGIPSKTRISFTSPLQNIYLGSGAVLFSLRDDGRIDDPGLRLGQGYLAKVFEDNMPKLDGAAAWKVARDESVLAQKLYFIRQKKRTV